MTAKLHPEYERKWLLTRVPDAPFARRLHIRQGYIEQNHLWVRIRETTFPDGTVQHILCRKLPLPAGNMEWETPLPRDAFDLLWSLCACNSLVKTRCELAGEAGLIWEIDVYEDNLSGLVVMELELPSPDADFQIPQMLSECIDREVTGDPAWSNRSLARRRPAGAP